MSTHFSIPLPLRHAFSLAHGASTHRTGFGIRLGLGWGEGALPPYYPDTFASCVRSIEGIKNWELLSSLPLDQALDCLPTDCPPARCAADLALHDHAARLLGLPLGVMLGITKKSELTTSLTIAIDEPALMAERARDANVPILKIKLGTPHDVERIQAIRRACNSLIRVDANGGWTREQADQIIPKLADLGVELVEQPLEKSDLEGLRWLQKRSPLPIYADESFQTQNDLVNLVGAVDGIVVKLMKTGGIRGALQTIHQAQKQGLKVMISCMIESSLAVTAAAHLAPLCDVIDLDSPLLLASDPFNGVTYDRGQIFVPTTPGIGAALTSAI